jgi:hypothetical protein
MSLVELVGNLTLTLAQLEAARRGAQHGNDVDERMQQWSKELGSLLSARQGAEWLHVDLSQVATYLDQFAHTRQLAQQAAERLEQRQNIEVLTEEDLWVRLLQMTQKTADAVWAQVKRSWGGKVAEYNQLSPFQQLRVTVSPVPQNDALLTEYEAQYRDACRLANQEVPRSARDPETFTQAIESCKTLAAHLRFDATKYVEEFFRAINEGGASLVLVTPTVLVWLADNDQLSGFTVRRKGR